jgi:ADP-ribosylglycohydrolase/tetratricopeptide (TPR) repeat protein
VIVEKQNVSRSGARWPACGAWVSIFEETGGGQFAVAHDRSLELFFDRYDVIARFISLINDDPPPRRVLYLHGLGGNGKSLLLRFLAARCCVRLSPADWNRVRRLSAEELPTALSTVAKAAQVPVARIDFGARPVGENRPQECFSALFMLKQQLARHHITTPRFDFAAVTYLHKMGFDLQRRLPELFPDSELGIALGLADAFMPIQLLRVGQDMFDALDKRLDDVFTRRRVQRRLPKADAQEILSLAPEPDLIYEMPRLFAADLHDAMGEKAHHQRLVLLFDTHEAFFGEAVADPHALVHADYLMRDEWLRSLLGHLPLQEGVVAVVAGRTRPPWASASVAAIPDAFVEAWPVGYLASGDAFAYLEKAGVGDDQLRLALVDYASAGPGEVHPYFLGLCADVALAAQRRGGTLDPASFAQSEELTGKELALARRLLVWVPPEVEYAILALGACRSFTYRTFRYLGERLEFQHERSDFGRLVAFSFISPITSGATGGHEQADELPHTMHQLLRRSLGSARPDSVRRAHQVLEQRYEELSADGDFTARLEQLYHAGQLDPAAAAAEWVTVMDQCLAAGRYDQCRAMITLLADLPAGKADQARFTYRIARADIGLGRWAEAEALLASLPTASAHATLLRAELAFCQGDFAQAEELATAALDQVSGPLRAGFLFRLAEIELYRGRFGDAREHAHTGLDMARAAADPVRVCRWTNLLGEIEYFSGDVDTAAALVGQALTGLEGVPEPERDQTLLASLLQNSALVSEATGAWQTALEYQRRALEIRRETEDARGAAQSLHGIGKALCGLGHLGEAEHALEEAAQAADGLGEDLLGAKITHALADTRIAQGRLDDAVQLTGQALEGFRRHGTPYDVAAAQLTLARIAGERGSCIKTVTHADHARSAIEAGGYRVLYRLFPAFDVSAAARARAGLAAFAAGDALGVPWEGQPPHEIAPDQIAALPTRSGWPPGATSDDTAQMLLVARHLVATGGQPSEREFLGQLSRELPAMRGAGPTTTAAVERYRQTGQLYAAGGDTNGALMRILPAGWAIPATHAERRRDVVTRLTKVTHGGPAATAAACAVAAMGSYAVEGCPAQGLVMVALGELEHVLGEHAAAAVVLETARAAAEGSWRPGAEGVPLGAAGTLAAVLHVLATCGDDADGAMRYAVSLGGDTDTVAAITGGILGCRSAEVRIGWLDQVVLPDLAELDRLADGLHEIRRAAYG